MSDLKFAEKIAEAVKFFGLDFDTFTVPAAGAPGDERTTFEAAVRTALANAYKERATAAHPDNGGATDAMQHVNNTYDLFRGKTEKAAYAELLRQIEQHAFDKRKGNRPKEVQDHIDRAAKFWRDADKAEGNGDAHATYALYRAFNAELLTFDPVTYDALDRMKKSDVLNAILKDVFGFFDPEDYTAAMKQRLRRTLGIAWMGKEMERDKSKPIDGAIMDIHNNNLRVQLVIFDYEKFKDHSGMHPINGRKFGDIKMSIAELENAARLFQGKEQGARKKAQEDAAKAKADADAAAKAAAGGAGADAGAGADNGAGAGAGAAPGADAGKGAEAGAGATGNGQGAGAAPGGTGATGAGQGTKQEPEDYVNLRRAALYVTKLAERVREGEALSNALLDILNDVALAMATLAEAEKELAERKKAAHGGGKKTAGGKK